jgi:argininosuccinate lyase
MKPYSKVKYAKRKGHNKPMPKNWDSQYVQYLLEPQFNQAKTHFLQPLLEISRAHAIMLLGCNLLTKSVAQKILKALDGLDQKSLVYSQDFEDLFFALEAQLIKQVGADTIGNLQIARSRNDVDAALIRMVLRQKTFELMAAFEQLTDRLHHKALEGITWLMPGYTHHQPAQPTTLGHYLTGILSVLNRDTQRLKAAYLNINTSPLGAVAMTGTGFAINRQVMADLLGFDAILENGIDAVGAADHSLELLSALQISNSTLSRLTHDLIFWATQETNFFKVADSFVQISSIMPQKRNPVVLEHIRAKLARANGTSQTAFNICHNIPFGDVNDVAEPLLPVTLAALEDSHAAIVLLRAVLETSSFNLRKMQEAAGQHFMTATGLADALVGLGLTFKKAHEIVSKTVDYAMQHNLSSTKISAKIVQSVSDIPLEITDSFVQNALDPKKFVQHRTTIGGSSPEAVQRSLEKISLQLEQTRTWRLEQQEKIGMAQQELKTQIGQLLT